MSVFLIMALFKATSTRQLVANCSAIAYLNNYVNLHLRANPVFMVGICQRF